MQKITRRIFIKASVFILLILSFVKPGIAKKNIGSNDHGGGVSGKTSLRGDPEDKSRVYIAKGNLPEENMKNIINALGGIDKIIGNRDIVVLKPNAQWWNQGMTNTDAMKSFIDHVLSIEGFHGEIIIAENQHYKPLESRGWTTENRNGQWNLSELVQYFNDLGYLNVTKYFWQDGGPNPNPLEGNDGDGTIVTGPEDGDGYVWRDDLVYVSPEGRKCMMTYPVFTSSFSGITIDLKNGAWCNGDYLKDRPVKFINFSALNHHGHYAGATASVKNLMGVVDMTCGFQGTTPNGYYNTHFIGSDSFFRMQQKATRKILKKIGVNNKTLHWRLSRLGRFNFQHTGGCLGYWIKNVRTPDLNIITAHWVGWGSRTDIQYSSKPKALLASKNPIALDYYATKKILYDETRKHTDDNYFIDNNNPDENNYPLYCFLEQAEKTSGFNKHFKEIKA